MGSTSFLRNKVMYSPIASESSIRPQGGRGKRGISAGLMLTSLVDAFSILVIFLMMNSATESSDFEVKNEVKLPKATEAVTTLKTAVVRLHGKDVFVNDEAVKGDGLGASLKKVFEDLKAAGNANAESLVIIADRDQDFATLNPIIVAGSRVGFSEFKFAVERTEK